MVYLNHLKNLKQGKIIIQKSCYNAGFMLSYDV